MSVLGVVALAGLCAGAQEFRLRHYMRMVDAMQPPSLALCLWVVFHWSTQSRELVTDSTTLKNEPSLHLVACIALSCRGLVDTAAFLLSMAVNTARHKRRHLGVILHFHCLHQFPACDGDADCISKIKLSRFL